MEKEKTFEIIAFEGWGAGLRQWKKKKHTKSLLLKENHGENHGADPVVFSMNTKDTVGGT